MVLQCQAVPVCPSPTKGHLGCFQVLAIASKSAVHTSVRAFGSVHFPFTWVTIWEGPVGHTASVCLTSQGPSQPFSNVAAPACLPTTAPECSNGSPPSWTLGVINQGSGCFFVCFLFLSFNVRWGVRLYLLPTNTQNGHHWEVLAILRRVWWQRIVDLICIPPVITAVGWKPLFRCLSVIHFYNQVVGFLVKLQEFLLYSGYKLLTR